jgi:hypothetical protein
MTQVMVLFGKDLNDLAEKMNEFFEGRNIISSPIYQELYEDEEGKMYQYYSVVYIKSSETKELKMATESQIKTLWKTGWNGDEKNLTRAEAFKLLKEKFG